MLICSVFGSGGKRIAQINVPESALEIKYDQYIEFSVRTEFIVNWLSNQIDNGKPYRIRYGAKIAKMLASMLDADYDILKQIPIGREDAANKNHNTLFGMMFYLSDIMYKYNPRLYKKDEDCTFIHNGETYRIPAVFKDIQLNKEIPEDLTVQQVVEITDFERAYDQFLGKINDPKNGEYYQFTPGENIDKDIASAMFQYQINLKKIALLTASKEDIPADDGEFDMWLNERMKKFQDIDMCTGIDVTFFLTGIEKYSVKMKEPDTSLSLQS